MSSSSSPPPSTPTTDIGRKLKFTLHHSPEREDVDEARKPSETGVSRCRDMESWWGIQRVLLPIPQKRTVDRDLGEEELYKRAEPEAEYYLWEDVKTKLCGRGLITRQRFLASARQLQRLSELKVLKRRVNQTGLILCDHLAMWLELVPDKVWQRIKDEKEQMDSKRVNELLEEVLGLTGKRTFKRKVKWLVEDLQRQQQELLEEEDVVAATTPVTPDGTPLEAGRVAAVSKAVSSNDRRIRWEPFELDIMNKWFYKKGMEDNIRTKMQPVLTELAQAGSKSTYEQVKAWFSRERKRGLDKPKAYKRKRYVFSAEEVDIMKRYFYELEVVRPNAEQLLRIKEDLPEDSEADVTNIQRWFSNRRMARFFRDESNDELAQRKILVIKHGIMQRTTVWPDGKTLPDELWDEYGPSRDDAAVFRYSPAHRKVMMAWFYDKHVGTPTAEQRLQIYEEMEEVDKLMEGITPDRIGRWFRNHRNRYKTTWVSKNFLGAELKLNKEQEQILEAMYARGFRAGVAGHWARKRKRKGRKGRKGSKKRKTKRSSSKKRGKKPSSSSSSSSRSSSSSPRRGKGRRRSVASASQGGSEDEYEPPSEEEESDNSEEEYSDDWDAEESSDVGSDDETDGEEEEEEEEEEEGAVDDEVMKVRKETAEAFLKKCREEGVELLTEMEEHPHLSRYLVSWLWTRERADTTYKQKRRGRYTVPSAAAPMSATTSSSSSSVSPAKRPSRAAQRARSVQSAMEVEKQEEEETDEENEAQTQKAKGRAPRRGKRALVVEDNNDEEDEQGEQEQTQRATRGRRTSPRKAKTQSPRRKRAAIPDSDDEYKDDGDEDEEEDEEEDDEAQEDEMETEQGGAHMAVAKVEEQEAEVDSWEPVVPATVAKMDELYGYRKSKILLLQDGDQGLLTMRDCLFLGDSKMLVMAGGSALGFYDCEVMQYVKRHEEANDVYSALAHTQIGAEEALVDVVAAAGQQGTIDLINTRQNVCYEQVITMQKEITALAFDKDRESTWLLSVARDGTAQLWDVGVPEERHSATATARRLNTTIMAFGITSVCFLRQQRGYVVGGDDGSAVVCLINETGDVIRTQHINMVHTHAMDAMCCLHNDLIVSKSTHDQEVVVWDANLDHELTMDDLSRRAALEKREAALRNQHMRAVLDAPAISESVQFEAQTGMAVLESGTDSAKLFVGSTQGTVWMYDLDSVLHMHATFVEAINAGERARTFQLKFVGNGLGKALKVDAITAQCGRKKTDQIVRGVAVSADGNCLACVCNTGQLYLFEPMFRGDE